MRALVTGGAGFIGSHLVDALLARGDEVSILDNLSTGKLENIDQALANGAQMLEGDIVNREFVDQTLESVRPHTVFHLAAQGEVQRSIAEPTFDATTNVIGTVNLLESSKRIGLDRFVFASTGGAIYGEGSRIQLPATEAASTVPLCPYGQSKLACEQYLELYRRMYMFNSVSLRFGNVYGPRQTRKGESGVVAIFAERLLAGENPSVFGDGTQTRDFVYIDDVIDAVLTASRTDVEGPINLGTGKETSILQLLELLLSAGQELADQPPLEDLDTDFETARPGEVKRISIDPARAARDLGWSPTTPLDIGLAHTLEDQALRVGVST